jgi:DNA-binding MarR family transcriptional regulator
MISRMESRDGGQRGKSGGGQEGKRGQDGTRGDRKGKRDQGDKNGGQPRTWPARQAPPIEGMSSSPDATMPFHSVGFSLSTTGYAISRRFHEILAPLDLEPRDFALLRAVRAAEGLSQQALAERMRILPSRMVAFVDALETRGLLERRHNREDRRTRALHLTDDGRDLLDRAFTLALGHERDICADLSAEERERLLELLQRVALRLGLPAGVHASHAAMADE